MPSFSLGEINLLRRYNKTNNTFITFSLNQNMSNLYKTLKEKCCFNVEEVKNGYKWEISPYGRKVVQFYEKIKKGEIKSKKRECNQQCDSCS